MSGKKVRLLLDAMYITSGGGMVLLNYLLAELAKTEVDLYLLKDARNPTEYTFPAKEKIKTLAPSLLKRHAFFSAHRQDFDVVFTFNNLPPTLKLKSSRVYTYFHQALYLQNNHLGYGFKDTSLLRIKKAIIGLFVNNVDGYFVQTEYIKRNFYKVFKFELSNIWVLPFFSEPENRSITYTDESASHFIYISDGHPHKNHARLLQAWKKVNESYPHIQLTLTISPDKYPLLCEEIEKLRSSGVNIVNAGFQDKQGVVKLYYDNHFMVYPSLTESFGLGLIEAVQHGYEIVASDLDYVKSVVEPLHTFDPYDADSIAKAIIKSIEDHPARKKTRLVVYNQVHELIQIISTHKPV